MTNEEKIKEREALEEGRRKRHERRIAHLQAMGCSFLVANKLLASGMLNLKALDANLATPRV